MTVLMSEPAELTSTSCRSCGVCCSFSTNGRGSHWKASLVSVKFPLYTDAMQWQSLCRSSEGTLRACFTHFRYGQGERNPQRLIDGALMRLTL
jgi:hypothetical protein